MTFLLSSSPQEEKVKALLDAKKTLLDATFLMMIHRSPEDIDDRTIIAAQAKLSLKLDQYQGIVAISLKK